MNLVFVVSFHTEELGKHLSIKGFHKENNAESSDNKLGIRKEKWGKKKWGIYRLAIKHNN